MPSTLREMMLRPDNLAALKDAYDSSMAQGVEFNTATFKESLVDDWETDLATCPLPVHFAIGEKDQIAPVETIESLAQAHAGKVSFEKIAGGTAIYPFTHPDAFFGALCATVERT